MHAGYEPQLCANLQTQFSRNDAHVRTHIANIAGTELVQNWVPQSAEHWLPDLVPEVE
jgi:hypothetical protein